MEPKPSSEAIRCPHCGKLSRLPADVRVKTVRCPHCHAVWRLSEPAERVEGWDSALHGETSLGYGAGPSQQFAKTDLGEERRVESTSKSATASSTSLPLWWFVLGALSVLLTVVVVALVVVVILLVWQRPAPSPQTPASPPAQVIAPAEPPTPPKEDEELRMRGEATAAYLNGLNQATQHALLGFDPIGMFVGEAAPADIQRRLTEWEAAVASLPQENVDPLALQYKEEFAQKFHNLMNAWQKGPQLAAEIASAPPDKILDQVAGQLTPLATVMPLQEFANFLRTRAPQVKAELEKKYHREMPIFDLPGLTPGGP